MTEKVTSLEERLKESEEKCSQYENKTSEVWKFKIQNYAVKLVLTLDMSLRLLDFKCHDSHNWSKKW